MAAACIFCGGKPTTVEHVLGRKWIADLMPASRSFTTRITRTDDEGESDRRAFVTKAGKGGGGSHPVRCACKPCNNGWMQDMDNTLRPALSGLVLGEVGTLWLPGCRMVAMWATKLAMLIDEMWQPPVLDLDVKRSFGTEPKPPAGWTFFAALRDDTPDESNLRAATLTPNPASTHVEAMVFTIRVLHFVVQALAPIDPVVLRYGVTGTPYVHRLWPRDSPLLWPPPQGSWLKTDKALQRLEQSIEAHRPHAGTPGAA